MSEIPWTLWLWGLAAKGGKGVVDNIDARCLGRIADDLVRLHKENERLRALIHEQSPRDRLNAGQKGTHPDIDYPRDAEGKLIGFIPDEQQWPEVTKEQVEKIDALVKPEFETGNWETVDSEESERK